MSTLERLVAGVLALVVLTLLATLGGHWYGSSQYQAGVLAEREAQHGRELVATVSRVQENAVEAAKQQTINLTVTETNHAQMAPVLARINAAPGVRVGAALCGGAAPAPETASTGGGNGPDTSGRVVRSDVDRDIRTLKIEVEKAFAAGRTCQAWAVANGMAPPQPDPATSAQAFSAAISSDENTTPEK